VSPTPASRGRSALAAAYAPWLARQQRLKESGVSTPLPPEDVEAARQELHGLLRTLRAAPVRPDPVGGMLARLCAMLGLSDRERAFVGAALDDAADFDLVQVLADYLEEHGRTKDGARLRRLSPKDGDVLVLRVSGVSAGPGAARATLDAYQAAARALCDRLARVTGTRTAWVVMSGEADLEVLDPAALRAAGWVRAAEADTAAEVLARLEGDSLYVRDPLVHQWVRAWHTGQTPAADALEGLLRLLAESRDRWREDLGRVLALSPQSVTLPPPQ
jgi:hypothetical protein